MKSVAPMNPEEVEKLYLSGMTDSEIAKKFGVDRTAVVHARKKRRVPTRLDTGNEALEAAEKELESRGFEVDNMRKKNKLGRYDLLVDGAIRAEVMGAKIGKEGNFKYTLAERKERALVESEARRELPNGRMRELYRVTCDFLICVGFAGAGRSYWVIPSGDLSDTLQTLSLTPNSEESKYAQYEEAWHLIKKRKKGG